MERTIKITCKLVQSFPGKTKNQGKYYALIALPNEEQAKYYFFDEDLFKDEPEFSVIDRYKEIEWKATESTAKKMMEIISQSPSTQEQYESDQSFELTGRVKLPKQITIGDTTYTRFTLKTDEYGSLTCVDFTDTEYKHTQVVKLRVIFKSIPWYKNDGTKKKGTNERIREQLVLEVVGDERITKIPHSFLSNWDYTKQLTEKQDEEDDLLDDVLNILKPNENDEETNNSDDSTHWTEEGETEKPDTTPTIHKTPNQSKQNTRPSESLIIALLQLPSDHPLFSQANKIIKQYLSNFSGREDDS